LARPNWSQPLPRPIIIPDLLELTTLADVRGLIDKHLPAEYRAKFTWRQLSGLLKRVAEGQQDPAEVVTSLRIVLQLVLGLTLILYLVIMPCRDALPRFR
jgi:hypothetical protein